MRGFRLDPLTHDLSLDSGGRLETVEGDAATVQEIKTRLLFFKAENFADLNEGVPYFTEILVKGVDLARVRALIRTTILSVPSIVDVPRIEVLLGANRVATIAWTARTATGRVIRAEDFPPLLLA